MPTSLSVQPRPLAVNAALPASAAVRRAAVSQLLVVESVSSAGGALSSKPAVRRCRSLHRRDRRADRRTLDRFTNPAPPADSFNNIDRKLVAYRFKIRKNTNFTNLEKFVKTREIRFCTSLLSIKP